MKKIGGRQLRSYGVALLCVTIALRATMWLLPWLYPSTMPLFFVAVMVSAWYGGWRAGLLATILSTLAINYFFIEPFYSLHTLNTETIVRLSTFLIAAGFISLLNQSRLNALRRAQENLQALHAAMSREQGILADVETANERMETVLASINDGFYVLDRNWRFTYVNDRYCEMVAMQPSELLGQNIWELFPAAVESEAYVQFHQAIDSQTPCQFDYFYTPWNCWHDHRIYPSSQGLTVLLADISDRKRAGQALQISEERLHLAVTSARLGMWFWDIEPDVLIWTQPCKALFGLPLDDSAITYADFMAVLHPDDRQYTQETVNRALQDRVDYDIEYRAVWQDGTVHWIAAKGSCIYDATGKPIRMNGVVIDIDDRKRAELNDQFLNQLNTRLRQLSTATAMVKETISSVGEYLNVDRCLWDRIYWAEDLAIVEQDWHRQEVPSIMGTYQISEFILPDLVVLFRDGHPAVISDVITYPYTAPFADNLLALNIRALLAIPCVYEGRWTATLAIHSSTVRQWRSDEVVLLQEVVARLWLLIENARAIEDLRQSEAEFRQLANAMPQIVWVADGSGALKFTNDRWTEYTGLTLEQSREQAFREPLMPPEDREQLTADFVQAQQARSPYQSQFRLIQPDGSYLYFLTRAVPILDEQGQVRKWYGTSTDITGLKQLEADLRQKNAILNVINESSPAPMFVKDRQGRIIFANPATLEVLGKTAAEVIGYRDCDLYPSSEEAAKVMENDRRIMESGQMEVVEESTDGIRTFLGMKVPYRDEAGNVIGLIGISNDITDRVQLERDRERLLQQEQTAREAAENANRIKDEFLAVLSHELRTPLNPILGWSKLLQQGKLDAAKTQTALTTIARNAQLQVQLIDDLLDTSRILRGKLSLNVQPVNLRAVISAALETVHLAAEAKALHIQTLISPDVETIMGDAGRLQQVIWNLLSNAVKFTPSAGQITIALTQAQTCAQLQVIDTGKGINPDFLPYVFEHFRQEDGATTRKFGGLGLGLAIARQIVEMHGGQIDVDSQGEEQGTTFTVQLPLAPFSSQPSPTKPSSLSTDDDLSDIHILVVDDETDSREIVAFVLEQAGAVVTSVASGTEALQALEQSIPQVIVSDIGMPEMDGYVLLQQIRALEQAGQVPAIALTAYAGEFDQQQAIAAGFQRHISKPLEPTELIQAIAHLIEGSNYAETDD